MPDRNGYIGRAPSDSAVTVARQTFTPTGVTTDFTFAAGYVPGYFDVYINGAKQIEASDYTSTDGSTFSILNGGATTGDVIEGIAYKAFNAGTVTNAADFTVSGNLTVNGSATFVSAGTSVSFATTAYNLEGTPDVTVNDITARNITGVAATFTGVVTYEDVTNVDSVGIVTARTGVRVTEGGLVVTAGVSTFSGAVSVGDTISLGDHDRLRFGGGNDLQIYHDGSNSFIREAGTGELRLEASTLRVRNVTNGETIALFESDGAVKLRFDNSNKIETTNDGAIVTGILTATSFEGSGANLTNLPASGDSNDITACLFI